MTQEALATKPDNLNLVPGTCMVKGKSGLHKSPDCYLCSGAHTHTIHKEMHKEYNI